MKTSVRWLNLLLSRPGPNGPLSADVIEQTLMAMGLPSESRESVTTCVGPDVVLDVEVTSNRGDCLSHVGLARELAASPALKLDLLDPAPIDGIEQVASPRADEHPGPVNVTRFEAGEPVSGLLSLRNEVPDLCPLFLVRVIRGVRVQRSPAWLRAHLEALGQRPINAVVDVTNFIAAELGNPCHAFDMNKLAGPDIIVRTAHPNEPLMTLDAKMRTLKGDEVVVADRERAQGLAGVMGGAASEVSEGTIDVVLEMATWDPVAVRRAARQHQLRTAASHRFERVVDARTLEVACERAAALIALLTGGRVAPGVLRAGRPTQQATTVRLRPERCRALLGFDVPNDRMMRHLHAVGVQVGPLGRGGDDLLCSIPVHRPDLSREVDLIEEVARIEGLDAIPVQERMQVRVKPPQASERARAHAANVLTGLGFFETITFSFTTPKLAAMFVPAGLEAIVMDDARRGDEPALRPSVLTGLLACRRDNQHAGVSQPAGLGQRVGSGGVRLFEVASAYAQRPLTGARLRADGETAEQLNLALVLDCPGKSTEDVRAGVRQARGAVEALVKSVVGDVSKLVVDPAPPHAKAFDDQAFARLSLTTSAGRAELGYLALLSKAALAAFDLATPVCVAELSMQALLSQYPPRSRVVLPPAFPGIERDISLIVQEDVRYDTIASALQDRRTGLLESVAYVTTYRGKPLPAGKKSVTMRLTFRDEGRTLTHHEVDVPVQHLLASLKGAFAFELRT